MSVLIKGMDMPKNDSWVRANTLKLKKSPRRTADWSTRILVLEAMLKLGLVIVRNLGNKE